MRFAFGKVLIRVIRLAAVYVRGDEAIILYDQSCMLWQFTGNNRERWFGQSASQCGDVVKSKMS